MLANALATPTLAPPDAAASPLGLPTVTPPPIIPEPTPFELRSEIYSPVFGSVTGTPVPASAQLLCTPRSEVVDCYDSLLEMKFSYPAFMGEIQYTTLRGGGYAGFAYGYSVSDNDSAMGGRSRDFSEGRGPMYTDQSGFNGRDAADICAGWVAALCQQLSHSIIHIVILPQAEWLCSDAMMFQRYPHSILALDLPQHPLINGFAFSTSLLSPATQAEFHEQWYNTERQCELEHKTEMGQAMEQLGRDLEAGTADANIQARYDAILRLAESIQSPFIAAAP